MTCSVAIKLNKYAYTSSPASIAISSTLSSGEIQRYLIQILDNVAKRFDENE